MHRAPASPRCALAPAAFPRFLFYDFFVVTDRFEPRRAPVGIHMAKEGDFEKSGMFRT
jgi:hypothetical protein